MICKNGLCFAPLQRREGKRARASHAVQKPGPRDRSPGSPNPTQGMEKEVEVADPLLPAPENGADETEEEIPPWRDHVTIRGLVVSALLGMLFCIITHKLNLTVGVIPSLNVAAGLLGFFFVKSWTGFLQGMGVWTKPLTRQENTVIQACVVARYGLAFSVFLRAVSLLSSPRSGIPQMTTSSGGGAGVFSSSGAFSEGSGTATGTAVSSTAPTVWAPSFSTMTAFSTAAVAGSGGTSTGGAGSSAAVAGSGGTSTGLASSSACAAGGGGGGGENSWLARAVRISCLSSSRAFFSGSSWSATKLLPSLEETDWSTSVEASASSPAGFFSSFSACFSGSSSASVASRGGSFTTSFSSAAASDALIRVSSAIALGFEKSEEREREGRGGRGRALSHELTAERGDIYRERALGRDPLSRSPPPFIFSGKFQKEFQKKLAVGRLTFAIIT